MYGPRAIKIKTMWSDERAVSFNVGYVISVAIATILVLGLIMGVGGVLESQQDRAVEHQTDVIGDQTAAGVMAVDRLGSQGDGTNTTLERQLPSDVVGTPYSVSLINYPSGPHLVVEAVETGYVTEIPVEVDADVKSTAVPGGATIEIVHEYDPNNGDRTIWLQQKDQDPVEIQDLDLHYEVENADAIDVEEGETVVATADIQNTGSDSGTQVIEFLVNEEREDSNGLTLGPGDSEQVTLEWDTTGSPGSFTGNITSLDDYDFTPIIDVAGVDVDIDTGASELDVEEGEDFEIVVDVTAYHDDFDQDIEAVVDGDDRDSESVDLDGSSSPDSDTITLTFESELADDGETITVRSDNASDEVTLSVTPENDPELDVQAFTITDKDDTDEFAVSVTVEETEGIETDGLEVDLVVESPDGATVYDETIDAGDIQGEQVTVTFGDDDGTPKLGPFDADASDYTATATASANNANDDSASETFNVDEAPAEFEVTIIDAPSSVEEGENVEFEVDVENVGSQTATQTIELEIDGGIGVVDTEEVEDLSGGDSTTIVLVWDDTDGNAGDYVATVESNDDMDTHTFTVNPPAADDPSFDFITIEDGSNDHPQHAHHRYAEYTVDYVVDDPDGVFDRVEVQFTNLDNSGASETLSSTAIDDEILHDPGSLISDYGDEYEIVIELYNNNDEVVDTITVTDTADGDDPDHADLD